MTILSGITSIGNCAFEGCIGLAEVTIPQSVTSIGNSAFYGCTGLISVTIFNAVTTIGNDAFCGCTGLKSVTILDGVTTIGKYAFENCTSLAEVSIPNSVTSIGDGAFEGCTGLANVTISNGVVSIGENAFFDCISLVEVTIPNSVMTIGSSSFGFCDRLTHLSVDQGNPIYDSRENCNAIIETGTNKLIAGCQTTTIPNSVTCIDKGAFHGCIGLTEVTIPNSVTTIGNYAFTYCTGLTEVTIPNSVSSIGDNTFDGCTALTNLSVEMGNPVYDSRENCNSIIETATNTLIAGCQTTTIPNSVTTIGNYAFSYCTGLTEVTIPNSVTTIGSMAFSDCSAITSVIVEWSTPIDITKYVFYRSSNATLYVPMGTRDAYLSAVGWQDFKEIVEYTLLDEDATAAPEAVSGMYARVKRTVKADEWSTICLPFDMTEELVKEAFGEDVKLGDFVGYEVNDGGQSILVQFAEFTAIRANHPYIIKVSEDVTSFMVDNVNVMPVDKPMVNLGTESQPKAFVGTYVAETVIENGCLFLSDNKFWYSVGKTKSKGLRGYFDFADKIPEFGENGAEVRAAIVYVDNTTGVDKMANGTWSNGKWYDLSGRRVTEPQRGIYIVNGSKVVK